MMGEVESTAQALQSETASIARHLAEKNDATIAHLTESMAKTSALVIELAAAMKYMQITLDKMELKLDTHFVTKDVITPYLLATKDLESRLRSIEWRAGIATGALIVLNLGLKFFVK